MMNRRRGAWILFLVLLFILSSLHYIFNPSPDPNPNPNPLCWSCLLLIGGGHNKIIMPPRKLKEEEGGESIDVDDYVPIDPVPSSKATSLRPGPIEHGTPLMPYIPEPAPPTPGPDPTQYAP